MKSLNLTGVLSGSAAIITILLENRGVLSPTTNTYSVLSLNAHVLVRIKTFIMSHAVVSIQRGPRATLGHSPMLFTRHGEIANWRYTEVLSLARLGTLEKVNRKVIPAMTCQTTTETSMKTQHHITHPPRSEHHPAYNAMVARLLTSKEVNNNPKAFRAILEEGEKLLKQGVWYVIRVREKRDVIRDAMRLNKKVHFARIFPTCFEKGSGLPEGDPNRKFKGRCVVQGNGVKDENSHAAIFQELSSSPATLEAAKSVGAYGCMKGHEVQQCDAQQAYVQSELGVLKHGSVCPRF